MKIGVVADDITGADDIGICFAKGGARAIIYSYAENMPALSKKEIENYQADVIIIDTNSRFDNKEESYNKVFKATKILIEFGVDLLFKKSCSVFRGNIGSEFDAMLDASENTSAAIVLGYPQNGRTTINGVHYVNGIKLELTQFANDPIHPMKKSNLKEILACQTQRFINNVFYEEYNDPVRLKNKILTASESGYSIYDVSDDNDVIFLADILKNEKVQTKNYSKKRISRKYFNLAISYCAYLWTAREWLPAS